MISIIIIIIGLFLDVVILNNISFLVNDLTIFTPLLTFTSVILIHSFYYKRNLLYLSVCTNMLFFNGILFLLVGIFVLYFSKNIGVDYIKIVILVCFLIICYEGVSALIISLLGLVNISLDDVIYKIGHSLVLNLIYAELLFIVIKFLPKKININ